MGKWKAAASQKAHQTVALVGDVVTEVRSHWSKPAPGKHIPYKEMLNYSLGGVGYMLVGSLTAYMGLGATNTFLGSVVGLQPLHLYYMSLIMSVISVLFVLVRGKMVDNTQTRWGRFRPYIALMGIPVVLLCAVFVFILSNEMPYVLKLATCMGFSVVYGFIAPLFTDTFGELKAVMSPNSEERTLLITVHMLVSSAAPTVTGLLIPILTDLTGGYTNANTYKWIMVPIAIVGLFMTFFAAFGCKERLVVAKEYKPKIRVFKGVGEIYRNKYWWIRNFHAWAGFMEGGINVLFGWLFIYSLQNMPLYGVMQTINGTAAGICMVITPFVVKKFGYKKILIGVNIANIFLIGLIALSFRVVWLFFIFNWLNLFAGAFYYIIDPAMHCDVKDYQQYISGQRMDFMFGAAGVIGTPIGMLTGLFLPTLYEAFGLTTNYNVLYDPTVRNSMFNVLCLTATIGAVINLVPLFFYDFTEAKHRNIIKVLKVRQLFGDHSSGDLQPEIIKDSVEEVRDAYATLALEKPNAKAIFAEYKALKKEKPLTPEEKAARKLALKEKWRAYVQANDKLDEIKSAEILVNEMEKFDTLLWQTKTVVSEWVVGLGFDGIRTLSETIKTSFDIPNLSNEAITLLTTKGETKRSKDERALVKYVNKTLRQLLRMQKKMDKAYPGGIEEPDMVAYRALRDLPETNRNEIKDKFFALKKFETKMNRYHAVAEPYVESQKLLKLRASYLAYPEIEAMYEEANATVLEKQRLHDEEVARQKALKQAELDRVREERFQKLSPEKQQKVLEKRKLRAEKAAERERLLQSYHKADTKVSDGDDVDNNQDLPSDDDQNDVGGEE